MADNHHKSASKSKLVRSNKIMQLSPTDTSIPEDSEVQSDQMPLPRSHTPGHLSQKSIDKQRRSASSASEQRQRSHSVSIKSPASTPSSSKAPQSGSGVNSPVSPNGEGQQQSTAPPNSQPSKRGDRPLVLRSTSAIAGKPKSAAPARPSLPSVNSNRGLYTPYPPLPSPQNTPNVSPAPASGMYWSLAPGQYNLCTKR